MNTRRNWPLAERYYVDGVAYAEDHDIGTYTHCINGGYAWTLELLGRWSEAESLCRAIFERRELSPINRFNPLASYARIAARRGDQAAPALLAEVAELAAGDGSQPAVVEAALSRAEGAWLSGADDEALTILESVRDDMTGLDGWTRGAMAAWLRRCGAHAGVVDELAAAGFAESGFAAPYQALFDGDARGAAAMWQELDCPYDAALALIDAGAEADLREALRILDELGATAAITRVQVMLRERGVSAIPRGRRAETRANEFGLTRREQEVLGLLVDGRTNAEIAASLFISERTVDNHVANVLAKMDVPTRRDAARKAAAHG